MMLFRAVRITGRYAPVMRSRTLASLSSVVNEANVLDGTLDTSSDFYKVRGEGQIPVRAALILSRYMNVEIQRL